MRSDPRRPLAFAVLLTLLSQPRLGAQAHPAAASASASSAAATPSGTVTNHVVVISIDGLRADAIERFGATNLQRLMGQGSYTLRAQTIDPSKTLPSHTSMLTGEEPARHGITWNSDQTDEHGVVSVPTIFARAHQHGFRTAAFFSKTKFHHLQVPNTLDYTVAPTEFERWSANRTVGYVERYLADGNRPNLLFVHIGEPDYAGHTFSWMSWFYGRAVRSADRAVDRILRATDIAFGPGQYTVVITADHGGHGWSHGTADPRDVTIPWIAWGEGVRPGGMLPDGIRTMDTSATVLWALGLEPLGVGRPVIAAFQIGGSSLPPAAAAVP
jgi:predicted AlkP superfamily pyrophosphatase or phosphodiesterase